MKGKIDKAEERKARLAKALKANLGKRKAKAKALQNKAKASGE